MTGAGKLYVVVNNELGMSAGKVAAQVAHATARIDALNPKTVIVLEGNTEQLHNLDRYCEENGQNRHLYIDEGVNEIDPMSATALAIGLFADDYTPEFLSGFKLYKERGLWRRLTKH